MTRLLISLITASLALLIGCTTSVSTDYETQHDFSAYRNYTWNSTDTEADAYIEFGGDIFDSRLRRAVSQSLQSRDIHESDPAQFSIQYHLSTKERAYHDDNYMYGRFYFYGHPYYRGYFPGRYPGDFGPNRPQYVTVGTLTMQVKDLASDRVVWTSKAKTFLSESKKPSESEARIQELASKMFAEFPPVTLPTP